MDIAPSLPSEIVIATSSMGAVIVSSKSGEFSSGQIESLATNPRQFQTTQASLRGPPVLNTAATGSLHWLVVNPTEWNIQGV